MKTAVLESLFKKRLQRSCFPVEFAKFLRTPILKNISKQLLENAHDVKWMLINSFMTEVPIM